MSDFAAMPADRPDATPTPAATGTSDYAQPAVPPLTAPGVDAASDLELAPSATPDQPYSLDLEPTEVDPFHSRGGDYPEFSYADQAHTQPIPDLVDPNPFAAPSNYAQPSVPSPAPPTAVADLSIGEPAGLVNGAGTSTSGVPAVYQSYPPPAPVSDPIRYNYGYNTPPVADHPNALPSMLLGIASLAFLAPLGIIGLILAQKGRRAVAANPGRWASGGTLTAGYIISMIGTVLTGVYLAVVVGMIVIMMATRTGF